MIRRGHSKKKTEITQKSKSDTKVEKFGKNRKQCDKKSTECSGKGERNKSKEIHDEKEKSVDVQSHELRSDTCRNYGRSMYHRKRQWKDVNPTGENEACADFSRESKHTRKSKKKGEKKDKTDDNAITGNKKIKFSSTQREQREQREKLPARKRMKKDGAVETKGSTSECHTNAASTCSNDLEIPGFYYDPQKKKYFRIQPNQFSKVEHTITKETINKKRKEEKRCSDMTGLSSCSKKGENRNKKEKTFPFILNQYRCGDFTPSFFYSTFLQNRLSHMAIQPLPSPIVVQSWPHMAFSKLDHSIQLEKNGNSNRIVGLYSVKNNLSQKIQLMEVNETLRTEDCHSRLAIEMKGVDSTQLTVANKVSSMCWAEQNLFPNDLCILYTVMSYVNSDCPNYVALHSLFSGGSLRVNPVFPIGNRFIWSCAWDRSSHRLSVGSEKCALVLDTISRRMWEFNTNNSDVFSQVFSGMNGRSLYSGTRNGKILIHDLRSRSTYPTSRVSMSSSVCSLRLLQNNIHLLASDVRGKVCLWDLRMIRQNVVEYKGSYNVYSRIPIHVEESADLVYGVDLNGYARLWSLRNGTLLRTVPPPVSTDIESIPTVLYSDSWGDKTGNSGLLMGIHDKVYLYPT
ncbi:hypothetical protein FSP39_025105 [Pinctada imbricata]|uniref:Uncharacterized protein n=1 Tax=Pinctada imbricata TaxID=66713 RepID=A0AA89C4A5_PINIB|nr:hypothetical protein FSP39_025105 [Pinctada imbricata]